MVERDREGRVLRIRRKTRTWHLLRDEKGGATAWRVTGVDLSKRDRVEARGSPIGEVLKKIGTPYVLPAGTETRIELVAEGKRFELLEKIGKAAGLQVTFTRDGVALFRKRIP